MAEHSIKFNLMYIMNRSPSLSSLQEICFQSCYKLFNNVLFTTNNETLYNMHNYLEVFPPLLIGKVAKRCRYHMSGSKTLLFIPFLLQKGQLNITDENIDKVILWADHLGNLNKMEMISNLGMLSINVPRPENYFKLLPFISKVSCILRLEINSWANDDILASLGIHCKKLEILDARGDASTDVTDTGLGYLSQCKTLKMVLFSNIADEFDYEDKFKFTGKGIALLMLSLPKLERIECPEYLVRDSLHYIYQMNFMSSVDSKHYLNIKSLYLAYPDVPDKTVNLLPILCPYLETLSIYIPKGKETVLKSILTRLSHLKRLKLKFESVCIDVVNIFTSSLKLDFLIIDTQYMKEVDLYYLGIAFPNLTSLCLCVHSFGFVPKGLSNIDFPNIYENVHTLQLEQRISGKLFEVINLTLQNLKELHLKRAIIYDVETAIKNVIANGGWKILKILIFPQNCTFCASFLFVNLSLLEHLKYLAVKFSNVAEEIMFLQSTRLHLNGRIILCKDDDFQDPSKSFIKI